MSLLPSADRDLQTERHLVELRTLAQLVLEFIAGARLEDEQDILRRFSHDAIVDYFCKVRAEGLLVWELCTSVNAYLTLVPVNLSVPLVQDE